MNLYKAIIFKALLCLAVPCMGASYYGGGSTIRPHGHSSQADGGKIANLAATGRLMQLTTRNIPAVYLGGSAPTSTPTVVGDIFIDTTTKDIYQATGSTGTFDWTWLRRGQTSAWTSTNPTGLIAWYDASNGVVPNTPGSTLTGWNDLSASANHLTAVTGTPKVSTFTQNGLQMVYFDGSSIIGGSNKSDIAQPQTWYFAFRPTAWSIGARQTILDERDSSFLIQKATIGSAAVNPYAGAAITGDVIGNSTYLMTIVINGASSSVQINDNPVVTGDLGSNLNTNFPYLGGRGESGDNTYIGYIMEIRGYQGVHSATVISNTKSDINKKWKLY